MKKIFLATKNKKKIEEIKTILSNYNIEIISINDGYDIPEVKEDGLTFMYNSQKKALEIAKYLNIITIADDSGLCVEALNGEPGVYSARYAGEDTDDKKNNEKLIKNLKKIDNRNAKFVCVVSIAKPDGTVKSYTGEVIGEIIDIPRGTNGFGYDPHFYYEPFDKTFAELTKEEKSKISHRGNALKLLKKDLVDFIK
ncbi:non-canonical purine NTP pyrophosphatase (RdgB/HAM1 family) [Hypnocyclicus thermotrophus]|uniref:dITP/XTP pyrophosphatase n=1 Tax=Hypnocyclicus thermotrophus TaxID=1627895 RepID=A0AA46DZM5_9FUSO|nr:XTP/dITP diphosphatase [Hypnocyclicus thermotrophus]TDT71884.1 non-canonical purine NTP pyrophosphatase (RdgB/HAM1 family) [Hypnocyclicus thermotrophus]